MACHPCSFGKTCGFENACRRSVTPEAMYGYFNLLSGKEIPAHFEGVRAWRTRTGPDGFMDLESLSGHDGSDHALWIAMQRAHFLPFLDGGIYRGNTGLAGSMSPQMADELSKTLTSAHDLMFLLSRQGMLLAHNPRPQAKAKYLASWQQLQNILTANSDLNILGSLWMFETQQRGGDLSSLMEMTVRYQELFSSLKGEFV